jgi:pimeloyl-ACP methyl ester carboxylesterase
MALTRYLRGGVVSAGREVAAFARQALLLPYDLTPPDKPIPARAGDDVLIFLHGLFATAGVLRPIRRAVAKHAGIHDIPLSYPPGPGIEAIAARTGDIVRQLPDDIRVHLIGHSLGGIVARFFAQETPDPRIVQTISMASPFAGVTGARMLGFAGARDMDPASPLLRRIVLGAGRTTSIPHLSIVAGSDAVVKSPVTHALPGGDVVIMHGRGHNTLLFDEEVARIIEQRVLSFRRR